MWMIELVLLLVVLAVVTVAAPIWIAQRDGLDKPQADDL